MSRYPRISDTPDRFDEQGHKLCRNCDSLVSPKRKYYCSQRCMSEFLHNNSWNFVRKAILRRDSYCCHLCKQRFTKRQLDVDHIVPVKQGGKLFDKSNLQTLCKKCHKFKSKMDFELDSLF